MASWSGQQALTVVLPVREELTTSLGALLEAQGAAVEAKLSGVKGLHFARFALIPRGERPPGAAFAGQGADGARAVARPALLFESTVDGDVEEHLRELASLLGSELTAFFAHCECGAARSLEAKLRYGSRRTSALFSAHPGLTVERIQTDARVRAAFRAFSRRTGDRLRERSALAIAGEARARLLQDLGADVLKADGAPVESDGATTALTVTRKAALVPLLARSAVRDVADLFSDLWTDAKLDRSGLDERLERIAARDAARGQRALTHVVELKPGRARRRGLAAALRFLSSWLRSEQGRRLGSSHFARWVELGDGRLAFLSHHDQSFEAELGAWVEELGFVASLVWSHTRDFPPGFGAVFGGARDEARFKEWARAKRVPTPIAYSAYPALSVGEVARGAELRRILTGDLDEERARRALELV